MSHRGEPHLLFSLSNVEAFHIQHGHESSLTPSGPQTLSLLMVSSASPFDDLSNTLPQNEAPEEVIASDFSTSINQFPVLTFVQDFYLHLHLPPELDLPLPATTQIFHQPPRSYLIPRWDLGPDSGAFTRISFPEKATQDDIDTFETILAQCTAFLERAPPPTGDAKHKPYNPADYAAGGKYGGGKTQPGQLVLIDEDDGSVVGELGEGAQIIESPSVAHGSKSPVEIEIAPDGKQVHVHPVSEDYLRMARHPAYRDSSLVKNAAAASRLIVTSSSYLGNLMNSGAESFTQKTKPAPKAVSFTPATHERMRKLHSFTNSGAAFSAKTVGSATKYAQNMGARVAGKSNKGKTKGVDKDGNPVDYNKPGFMNKSMIAFSTIADGIAQSGRDLLTQGGAAASTVIGHRYGPEAGTMAARMAGGVKNVGLVYIDVTGVSRRAVIKSVAKGMVVGEVKGGGQVVVGGGDGGTVPESDMQKMAQDASGKPAGVRNDKLNTGSEGQVAEFGRMKGYGATPGGAPPPYTSDLGEPLGSGAEKARPPGI